MGGRQHVPDWELSGLVLPGHLARCLPAPGRRRVPGVQRPNELAFYALGHALTLRRLAPGRIVHADRGRPYTRQAGRTSLEAAGALTSFGRPGNFYDNAQAKASWSTLKTELLPGGSPFASLEEARLEVAWYPGTYFNLDRRHSAPGYRSPNQFEQKLKSNLP